MRSLDDLTMYAYGLLDGTAEGEIRDHLRGCGDCRDQVQRIAAEHGLLEHALRTGEPPSRPEPRGDSPAQRQRGRLPG